MHTYDNNNWGFDPWDGVKKAHAELEAKICDTLGIKACDITSAFQNIDTLLKDTSDRVREGALALACLNPQEARIRLNEIMEIVLCDPSENVREAAVAALGVMNLERHDAIAIHFLMGCVKDTQNSEMFRFYALQTLIVEYNSVVPFEKAILFSIQEIKNLLRQSNTEMLHRILERVRLKNGDTTPGG